jgi:flavin reductase (DIM6/NTAB) family NADH-FMN oxidoreductase RutF
LFDGAIATVECVTTAVHDGGDHSIVVGGVAGLGMPSEGAPLLYHDGRYKSL